MNERDIHYHGVSSASCHTSSIQPLISSGNGTATESSSSLATSTTSSTTPNREEIIPTSSLAYTPPPVPSSSSSASSSSATIASNNTIEHLKHESSSTTVNRSNGTALHTLTTPALYSAVISPHEMAAHEAANFKNVKGVYKNCRGIWAAQWTDERGQRHTKYFNPKYFATEAEARHEAFRFKVHIAREIELRGGVQKRRSTTTAPGSGRGNDVILDQSYIRERQRKPQRRSENTSNNSKLGLRFLLNTNRDSTSYLPCISSSNLGNNAFSSLNNTGPQSYFDEQQLAMLHRQHVAQQQLIDYSPIHPYDPSNMIESSTSYGAENSPAPTLPHIFYGQGLDPLYVTPQFESTDNNSLSSPVDGLPSQATALPPGTSLCACGCGSLALSPARYAAHHKPSLSSPAIRAQASVAPSSVPATAAADGKESSGKKQPVFPCSSADSEESSEENNNPFSPLLQHSHNISFNSRIHNNVSGVFENSASFPINSNLWNRVVRSRTVNYPASHISQENSFSLTDVVTPSDGGETTDLDDDGNTFPPQSLADSQRTHLQWTDNGENRNDL